MVDRGFNQPELEEKNSRYRDIFDSASDGLIVYDLRSDRIVDANPAACKMHGTTYEQFIGMALTEFTHPDNQFVLSEHIRIAQSESSFDILTLQVRRNGSTFYAEWRTSTFVNQGQPCLLIMIRDVSKRMHIEQLLHQREETHSFEQTKLLEISHSLASAMEFHPSLILSQLREILMFRQGALFEIKDSTLVSLAMCGQPCPEQSTPIRIFFKGPEIPDVLFNGHSPMRISDVWGDHAQAAFFRSIFHNGAGVLLEGMRSWMWVPLAVKNHIIGGIGVAHEKRNYFTQHHADLALSVANQAAITITNIELYGHARELAILEERQHLARNLHDAVNQSLFSAGLIAEVLPRLWERDQEEARRSIDDLLHLTRGAQAEMRALLAELRPLTLTDSNLADLLHLLGNALTGRTNIPVVLDCTGEFTLPSEVQVTFYRICQEALFNVAKHARANQVEINLHPDGAFIEMRIRDDGKGFDPNRGFSGHYGLSMMRERAEAVGAVLSITSQPGRGTELTVRWTKTSAKEA